MKTQHSILIVDNDNDVVNTYRDYFKKQKMRVDVAHNSIEGLKKLREGEFHVALVNLNLPRMNGLEMIEMAKEEDIMTNMVILSEKGEGDRNNAITALNLGVKGWFEKTPRAMNELLNKVKELSESMSLDEIDSFISALSTQN
ncbi:MAG TPA: response regulator [Thiotrichaceae bacterium]|nr:response regulator [Thiotrichaceae bacterium]